MKLVRLVSSLSPLLALAGLTFGLKSAGARTENNGLDARGLIDDLGPKLSRQNLISFTSPPRWSSFNAPRPSVVVNVETELDVAVTVRTCHSPPIACLLYSNPID